MARSGSTASKKLDYKRELKELYRPRAGRPAIVDVPELCNFIVPSIMRQGELGIAVSTGGASPVVARTIRQNIEKAVGPEWGELVAMFRAKQAPPEQAFTFILMNVHTDPDEARQELDALAQAYTAVQRMPIGGRM